MRSPTASRPLTVLAIVALLMALFVSLGITRAPVRAAVGGPVILGGDDLTAHGSVDTTTGELRQGWLYIQRALENISPKVTRPNNASVAALGSQASSATSGDAGAAIGQAAAKAGLTVDYYNGADAINGFFTSLAAGTATPRIVWIAGNDASNDLDGDEETALNNNATAIGDFVNSGGGLMSHGVAYGWLSGLLPGLTTVNSGSSDDLTLTAAGVAAFPGVSNADINAGPWHNHFEGNFGGLQVLATSGDIDDSTTGADAAAILGGAGVVLPGAITLDPATDTNPTGSAHTVTATVRSATGALAPNVTVTFLVTAGPNTGDTGTGTTDQTGTTSFTYTGDGGGGTDTIQASFTDAASAVKSTTATKIWEPSADIALAKTASSAAVTAAPGSTLTYTLTVSNSGRDTAADVTLVDTLAVGAAFVSATPSQGTCTEAAGNVTCQLGSLAKDGSATVSIVVDTSASPTSALTLQNAATVTSTTPDPNLANNGAGAVVTLNPVVRADVLGATPTPAAQALPDTSTGSDSLDPSGVLVALAAILAASVVMVAAPTRVTSERSRSRVSAASASR